MSDGFSLLITGFKTPEQVKAFADWYEGQGEQDASIWFECRVDEGKLDVDFMPVDVHTRYTWEGNTMKMKLNIEEPEKQDD